MKLSVLINELKTNQVRKAIFSYYLKMLSVRKTEPAFNPYTRFKVLETDNRVFAVERIKNKGGSLIAVHNMCSEQVSLLLRPVSITGKKLSCLLTSAKITTEKDNEFKITLPSFHFLWLKEKK